MNKQNPKDDSFQEVLIIWPDRISVYVDYETSDASFETQTLETNPHFAAGEWKSAIKNLINKK